MYWLFEEWSCIQDSVDKNWGLETEMEIQLYDLCAQAMATIEDFKDKV